MRNKILIIIFILLIPVLAYATEVNLDISNSTATIIDSNTFRLYKVTGTVDGVSFPGQFWIDFRWDPIGLVFVPISIGTEAVESTILGTWTSSIDWQCDGTIDDIVYWLFNNDGSMLSVTENTANWSLQGNNIVIKFGDIIYNGMVNVTNDYISGTISTNGCWSARKQLSFTENTWNFEVKGFSKEYSVTLKTNANRTMTMSFTPTGAYSFICYWDIIFFQENMQFKFNLLYLYSLYGIRDTIALFQPYGWDGCGNVYQGQTVRGIILFSPEWFDPNSTFRIGIEDDSLYFEPDGTVHK